MPHRKSRVKRRKSRVKRRKSRVKRKKSHVKRRKSRVKRRKSRVKRKKSKRRKSKHRFRAGNPLPIGVRKAKNKGQEPTTKLYSKGETVLFQRHRRLETGNILDELELESPTYTALITELGPGNDGYSLRVEPDPWTFHWAYDQELQKTPN